MNVKKVIKRNIPTIGFGSFGNDKYSEETVAQSVYSAIKIGYRMFDCASVYGNECQIGSVFAKAIESKLITREDLLITGKVWNDKHGEGEVIESCKQSLKDLRLDYIDLYFVHWPFPNYHSRGCSVDSRSPDSKPFFTEDFMAVWRQMEWLKENGYVKEIAMSNMTIPKFEQVLPLCNIKPFAHEMELHPSFQQKELFEYCVDHDILPIGYCPIGSPNRPPRDTTPNDITDTQMPEIIEIAKKHNCHPVEVCLKWAVQNGQIPIPFSSKESNMISNLKAVSEDLLTDEEMQCIKKADKNCRLVKGHVFLWNGADDWTELWDLNGRVDTWKQVNNKWIKEK